MGGIALAVHPWHSHFGTGTGTGEAQALTQAHLCIFPYLLRLSLGACVGHQPLPHRSVAALRARCWVGGCMGACAQDGWVQQSDHCCVLVRSEQVDGRPASAFPFLVAKDGGGTRTASALAFATTPLPLLCQQDKQSGGPTLVSRAAPVRVSTASPPWLLLLL